MSALIFSTQFVNKCLELYKLHYDQNAIYNAFCKGLGRMPNHVNQLLDIPFLPIELFKDHKIYIGKHEPELNFKSSGTVNTLKRSTHYIDTINRYESALKNCFSDFFTLNKRMTLFGVLPGYVENEKSSLIFMLEQLKQLELIDIKGYYLNNYSELIKDLNEAKKRGEIILLWGVTFGLLDFAEKHKFDLKNHIVLETGGMKGRRKEITRKEVHEILIQAFNVKKVYSEYGMTELLSQAYSKGDGIFTMNNSLKVLVRDVYDPLSYVENGKSGALNIIDLSNEHSCPFIATQDLGRVFNNQTFEVLGRTDNSDIRGCNLMAV
ncbi:MAG: acyl transferase [Bacteroidia bacterium]